MNFYKMKWVCLIITGVVLIAGITGMFINGVKLDIQFRGGAILSYSYEGDINDNEVESIAKEILNRELSVYKTENELSNTQNVVLNIAGNEGLEFTVQENLLKSLKEKFPENNIEKNESRVVEPYIGRQALIKGGIAILISFALMLIYIWIRFRKIDSLSLGVCTIITLMHDLIIVFIAYLVMGIPINDSFIAVILTILGYSINDKIVIFDRIRENSKLLPVETPIEDLVNKSINQSLTRSLFTDGTTVVAAIAILGFATAYGITSIRNFSLPLLVGLVAGAYSSLFLCGPLWTMWRKVAEKRTKKK